MAVMFVFAAIPGEAWGAIGMGLVFLLGQVGILIWALSSQASRLKAIERTVGAFLDEMRADHDRLTSIEVWAEAREESSAKFRKDFRRDIEKLERHTSEIAAAMRATR